ncbi:MAG: helix-turn-helix domain-containing protein [Candidatus Cloacimonadaceae bacterium]|nr:helix-turn-helix domain-containing protein [Candidatus Cloacimonadaceae bacterium]
MKATTYETGGRVVKDDHCDTLSTVTLVTVVSNREKMPLMLITRCFEHCDTLNRRNYVTVVPDHSTTVTHHRNGIVTVLLPVTDFYWKRLKMSKRKINAVWLTVERVAELMNCSTRTVWRFVKRNRITVYKQQIALGSSRVMKAFLLTSPDILVSEMADCEAKGMLPGEFIEIGIEVDGKLMYSALIYQYRECKTEDGNYYEAL